LKKFAYICADPGIPIPGQKGSSIHVASVCRALTAAGLSGAVHTTRAEGSDLHGLPLRRIHAPAKAPNESASERETRLFLGNFGHGIETGDDCDFVYERYSLWHVGGLARARELGVPFILEVNSPLPEEAKRFRSLSHEGLADEVARLLMREADGIVCVSEAVSEWVKAHRGNDAGVWVVPNGVNPEIFSPPVSSHARRWPVGPGPLVVFSGSFRPWHGMDDLIRAFQLVVEELADAHLLCVGDGPLRESFEQQVREANLSDRVRVTGLVPQEEVASWLGGADVAVAPYPTLEQFYFSPLKIYEFLALGLPVVAANVGQIPRILGCGSRGLLYTPGQPQELARAIVRLLSDRDEARKLAREGRDWVLAHATWSRRVKSILARIEQLDPHRRSGSGARR